MFSPRHFFQIVFAAMLACLVCVGVSAQPHSGIFRLLHRGSYTELSFRLEHDLIIIPVVVDDTEEMNFILDTGTDSPVILNRKYIKHLELPLGKHMSFQGAGERAEARGQVINGMSLQIADAYAAHIGGVVLEKNPLSNLRVGGIKVHGVLGASLFSNFAVEIDYQQQVLRLHQNQQFTEEASFSVHEMQVSRSRPILKSELQCNSQQYEVNLMIDTGSSNALLIYDHTMFGYDHLPSENIGKGYCGNVRAAKAQVEKLTLVEQQLTNVKAIFPAVNSYRAEENEITDREGTIGNALLKHFCVVFDYAGNTLYLRDKLPAESPYLDTFLADERR